jgi:hypothetical protein
MEKYVQQIELIKFAILYCGIFKIKLDTDLRNKDIIYNSTVCGNVK